MAGSGRIQAIRVLNDFVSDAIVPEGQQPSQINRGSLGGLRDIGPIRAAFIEQRRQAHAAQRMTVDEDDLLNEWYCSEEFTQWMVIHGHAAKRHVLQANGE